MYLLMAMKTPMHLSRVSNYATQLHRAQNQIRDGHKAPSRQAGTSTYPESNLASSLA